MSARLTNVRKTLMFLAIVGTLVVTPTLIFSPQLAQAQQGKVLQGLGIGQVNCSPGESPLGNEQINFFARKDRNGVNGNWQITTEDFLSETDSLAGEK